MTRLLAFSGSSRRGSFNRALVEIAADGAREVDGVEVTLVDLGELELPLYHADLEDSEGLPQGAKHFKQLLISADGLLIASPEYNSSYTPLLKNAIDWASRAEASDEKPLAAFSGKKAALLAASPGGGGGARSLEALRTLLSNISVEVLDAQVTVAKAHQAFDDRGKLTDDDLNRQTRELGARLAHACSPA